jgi:hypothetical protein
VRKDKIGRTIIHAKYSFDDPQCSQSARVGRYLPVGVDLIPNVLAVADELRERIDNQDMREFVAATVDACFTNLPPIEM